MRLKCDNCDKIIENYEEYFFHSKNQVGNGMTLLSAFFKQNGKIYCKKCLNSRFNS